MQPWIKNTLFAVVMLCAMIIGTRLYLELDARNGSTRAAVQTGAVAGAPESLPEFTLNDAFGQPRNIREWAGQPLLINFWATWCAPCRREIPLLETLHKEQDQIQVVGVAIDRLPDVEAFLGEYGVSYPNLVGQEDALAVSGLFGLEGLGLPFSVIAASDAAILTVHVGEIDAAELRVMVNAIRDYETGNMGLDGTRAQLQSL